LAHLVFNQTESIMLRDDKRKHVSQMTPQEIRFIEDKVQNFGQFSISPHTQERMEEKRVSLDEALYTLRHGYLIEVHNNNGVDVRAVMQFDTTRDKVSVVVSLVDGEIKTVWRNAADDVHATRDTSKYRWTQNLISVLYAL
jgi:hypothetical protein